MWKNIGGNYSRLMLLTSVFNKFVISVKGIHCFKMMKRSSDLWRPLFNNMWKKMWKTWPKMPPNLQMSWLLWYFNLILSLSCCWLHALSPANEHVLVWLGEKVFDTVESLPAWDCPLSMIIVSLGYSLFLSFFPIFLYLFFFSPQFP